jgi:hypothetical protein
MATPSGIGPIAEIGPGGAYAGRIVGLVPLLKHAAVAGAVGLELSQMAKDYNDRPSGHIVGSVGGRVATRHVPGPADLGGQSEEEFAAHAAQAAKENRQFYNRTIGTPKRRPMSGGLGDDFSDLEKRTP